MRGKFLSKAIEELANFLKSSKDGMRKSGDILQNAKLLLIKKFEGFPGKWPNRSFSEVLRSLSALHRLRPMETADASAEADTEGETDWTARLPRRVGWERSDWHPEVPGPFRSLACHYRIPVSVHHDGPMESPDGQYARFAVDWTSADGISGEMVGRLDDDSLHLLIRTDKWLGSLERHRMMRIAESLRLSGERRVVLRFDLPTRSTAAVGDRSTVDRRA